MMWPARMLVWLFSAAAVVGAHEEAVEGRRTPYFAGTNLWGRCDGFELGFPGCDLQEEFMCSSRESTGPAHANMEVKLAGLPASSGDNEVWLQFFAAYESERPYNPLDSILGASVYPNFSIAYPRYDDAAFNGGNVKVNEDGTATVRFLAPAGYIIPGLEQIPPVPHLHLRLCMEVNQKNLLLDPDVIIWYENYLSWVIYKKWFFWQPTSIKYLANQSMDRDYSVPAQELDFEEAIMERQVDILEGSLDPSVLEFSPVYQCLSSGSYYDQTTESCVEECPGGLAIAQGQCVRRRIQEEDEELTARWEMEVDCDSGCQNLTNAASHHTVRLHVAAHMDCPFQEVKVVLELGVETEDRRLATMETLTLTVEVDTRRWNEAAGQAQLDTLLDNPATATSVVEYPVQSVNKVEAPAPNADDDPFQPAYDALLPTMQEETSGTDGFPVWAVVAIVAGAAVVGLLLGLFLFFLRERRRKQAENRATVEGKVVAKAEAGEASMGNESVAQPPRESEEATRM